MHKCRNYAGLQKIICGRVHGFRIIVILCAAAALIILVLYRMLRSSRHIQVLMYRDTELGIWNLSYLKYKVLLQLSGDRKYAIVYTDITQFKRYGVLYGWQASRRILELFVEVASKELVGEKELLSLIHI